MYMIEIAPLENGAHRNQTYHGTLPEGWALVPEELACENFPFGDILVEDVDGLATVTGWLPGTMPECEEPEPVVPEDETSVWDELDAAYQEGVNSI